MGKIAIACSVLLALPIIIDVIHYSDATTLRAGDSVRLRMDAGKYTDNFLTSNITHADVGYILEVINENNKRVCHNC